MTDIPLLKNPGQLRIAQQQIRDVAADVLWKAYEKRASIIGAINWAHLRIVNVIYCFGIEEQFWQLCIEEAAPDATDLHQFIIQEMQRVGFDVRVRTEW